MAIALSDIRQGAGSFDPPRILIYGPGGVGKTSFAAQAPNPIFIWTEEGEGILNVPGFPTAKDYNSVMEALYALYNEDHGYQTLIVDSVDWLEPLIWKEVCQRNNWRDIEAPGFGKGYVAADGLWSDYLEGLAALRDEKKMAIIQIAHDLIARYEDPENEPYDRHTIKLHKRAAGKIYEHADIVGYANYVMATVQSDSGFNKKVVRGVGGGDRQLSLVERPAFLAKNRYGMPPSVPLPMPLDQAWSGFAQHIPFFNIGTQPASPAEAA